MFIIHLDTITGYVVSNYTEIMKVNNRANFIIIKCYSLL